ncbi:MAG: hypothetical protein LKE37_00150 [Atopobiaceae bacterium]|jgi:hypothetical protein|nr:hypothetical protein [Atopobiaceae bacterium]
MIDQLSVFMENEPGRLTELCRAIGDAGVNMHALTIADTTDFGIVRIICDAPEKAALALKSVGYSARSTKVMAVAVPNEPGGLAALMDVLKGAGVNVEYAYCFATPDQRAVFVMKTTGGSGVAEALAAAGFEALQPKDVYSPDEL